MIKSICLRNNQTKSLDFCHKNFFLKFRMHLFLREIQFVMWKGLISSSQTSVCKELILKRHLSQNCWNSFTILMLIFGSSENISELSVVIFGDSLHVILFEGFYYITFILPPIYTTDGVAFSFFFWNTRHLIFKKNVDWGEPRLTLHDRQPISSILYSDTPECVNTDNLPLPIFWNSFW